MYKYRANENRHLILIKRIVTILHLVSLLGNPTIVYRIERKNKKHLNQRQTKKREKFVKEERKFVCGMTFLHIHVGVDVVSFLKPGRIKRNYL